MNKLVLGLLATFALSVAVPAFSAGDREEGTVIAKGKKGGKKGGKEGSKDSGKKAERA